MGKKQAGKSSTPSAPEPVAKGKKGKKEAVPEPVVKGKKGKREEPLGPSPPVPNGRALVADSSLWTGKLPGLLLSEHCQKQKWGKVQYDMRKTAGGFIGTALLLWTNPKTREDVVVKMGADTPALVKPQETPLEARHVAATVALHRVKFAQNISMVLPPNHKQLWLDLDKARKELLKENKAKHDRVFNADPFAVVLERRKAEAQRAKEAAIQQEQQLKVARPLVVIAAALPKPVNAATARAAFSAAGVAPLSARKFPKKAWAEAHHVDLLPESRAAIEQCLKQSPWYSHRHEKAAATGDTKSILTSLTHLGFRKPHVEEALECAAARDFTEVLEWLVFHVPEDDLPPAFVQPRDSSSVRVKMAGQNLEFEYKCDRLCKGGYGRDEVAACVLAVGDEAAAGVELFRAMVGGTEETAVEDSDEAREVWAQEVESLAMVYNMEGATVVVPDSDNPDIVLIMLAPHQMGAEMLQLRAFRPAGYPQTLAGFLLETRDSKYLLAAYVKLSAARQLGQYLQQNGLVGDCHVYAAVDWIQEHLASINANPGPLRYIGAGAESMGHGGQNEGRRSGGRLRGRQLQPAKRGSAQAATEYAQHQQTTQVQRQLAGRKQLPAWGKRQELVSTIMNNQVTLVTGETGSGKLTQCVQFVLDALAEQGDFDTTIVCTQPRRISTIGLAERISDERARRLGTEVGYVIRGENKTSSDTRILFVTTGVLLRQLQGLMSGKHEGDSVFDHLGFIFIDEVHERLIDLDFLLMVLKRIGHMFPKLKVVLMLATIEVLQFSRFFSSPLQHVHIEGRTYPITDVYLDEVLEQLDFSIKSYTTGETLRPKADLNFFSQGQINYDLVGQLVRHVDGVLHARGRPGSILIFLPGVMEISKCIRAIAAVCSGMHLLPLHSALPLAEQRKVFDAPPRGSRKVVVATNVAETSITIPDAEVVVDCGRAKSMFYDPQSGVTKLVENWCSRAEAGQRRGRAGRVTEGTCYRMYTRETEAKMLPQPIPEIKRTRLEQVYLVVKLMGIQEVASFLNSGLDPPDPQLLRRARQLLEELGALVHDDITHLGSYLSMLPADLQLGKLLVLGTIFGCLDTCLTLALMSTGGLPFVSNQQNRDEVRKVQMEWGQGYGDVVAAVRAVEAYADVKLSQLPAAARRWLQDNHLSYMLMRDIATLRSQYLLVLKDIGFVPFGYKDRHTGGDSRLNRNHGNYSMVSAIVAAGFYPHVARVQLPDPRFVQLSVGAVLVDPDAKKTRFWIRNEAEGAELPATRAFLHPLSTVLYRDSDGGSGTATPADPHDYDFTPTVRRGKYIQAPFVVYTLLNHTLRLFLRDITPVLTLAVLLFGGVVRYDMGEVAAGRPLPGLVMDEWLPIRTWCKNGVLIKQLRQAVDWVVADKLELRGGGHRWGDRLLSMVEGLLGVEG